MLIDVIVPAPWWNTLTYNFNNFNFNNANYDFDLKSGQRVRVPLGIKNGGRVGFISGLTSKESQKNIINKNNSNFIDKNIEIKDIFELIDEEPVLKFGLWELALWLGRTFLCGAGMALKMICPNEILNGEKFLFKNLIDPSGLSATSPKGAASLSLSALPTLSSKGEKSFHETNFFNPKDGERMSFYIDMLRRPLDTLMLFPEVNLAKKFFKDLPDDIKNASILWPSTGGKKLWDAWREVYSGNFKNIIAPPGGVFAPLNADCIIVEEEASEGYLSRRQPVVSARSIAGKRALDLNAELILGGRMPSAKTFLRNKMQCNIVPERKNLIFVDVNRSLKINEHGIEGNLPLTISLLERTRAELDAGNNVLWLLDRKGGAAEVFCTKCGHVMTCDKCGGVMRSEDDGKILKCSRCAFSELTPEKCPECGGEILSGRRPGLEVLKNAAERLIKNHKIIMLNDAKKFKARDMETPSLIIGTRGALALCDDYNINLAAWLDLDSELRRTDYNARFRVFNMVWQSCWRGYPPVDFVDSPPKGEPRLNGGRKVLIQSRRKGRDFREFFAAGWEKFWREELELRRDLDLPPFGILILIKFAAGGAGNKRASLAREKFIRELEDEGLLVMNLDLDDNLGNSDDNLDNSLDDENNNDLKMRPDDTLWIETQSVRPVIKVLSRYFDIAGAKELKSLNLKTITVYAE